MAGAIVTGAIIVDGAIIGIGETSLPSCGDYSGKSRQTEAAFSFEPRAFAAWPHAKAAKGFPRRLSRCVAFARRCAASSGARERSRAYLPEDARPSMRCPVRCQCVGPTIPDSMACVTSDDADQASVAVLSMKYR
jgi:hypothetical protein